MINATPLSAPFPAAEFLAHTALEQSKISEKIVRNNSGPCANLANHARAKGIEPIGEKAFLELVEQIASTVKVRRN